MDTEMDKIRHRRRRGFGRVDDRTRGFTRVRAGARAYVSLYLFRVIKCTDGQRKSIWWIQYAENGVNKFFFFFFFFFTAAKIFREYDPNYFRFSINSPVVNLLTNDIMCYGQRYADANCNLSRKIIINNIIRMIFPISMVLTLWWLVL